MLRKMFFALFFMMTVVSVARADYLDVSSDRKTQSVEGRVASIDWVGASLILKFLVGATYDEMKLVFPKKAKITKSNEEISFSDIELSDLLHVEFYADQQKKENIVIRAEVVVD
ncbi:MAG: hypothetical protein ABIC68_05590 [Candidatus Omnitrophota bacterium]